MSINYLELCTNVACMATESKYGTRLSGRIFILHLHVQEKIVIILTRSQCIRLSYV